MCTFPRPLSGEAYGGSHRSVFGGRSQLHRRRQISRRDGAYERDCPNATFCSDGRLSRIAFMMPGDADAKAWYNRQRQGLEDDFILCVEAALDHISRVPQAAAEVYPRVHPWSSGGYRMASSIARTQIRSRLSPSITAGATPEAGRCGPEPTESRQSLGPATQKSSHPRKHGPRTTPPFHPIAAATAPARGRIEMS